MPSSRNSTRRKKKFNDDHSSHSRMFSKGSSPDFVPCHLTTNYPYYPSRSEIISNSSNMSNIAQSSTFNSQYLVYQYSNDRLPNPFKHYTFAPLNTNALNIPKVLAPPMISHSDIRSFCIESQDKFRDDLLGSEKSICTIMQKYSRQQVDYLNYLVIEYFDNLNTKLKQQQQQPALQYCQVVQQYENYVCYGQRFWEWCVESKLYNEKTLRNYSTLLRWLLQLCPLQMLNMICTSYRLRSKYNTKSKFDFKMAKYKREDDPWKIHNFIKRKRKLTFKDGSWYYANVFSTFPLIKEFFVMELRNYLNFPDYDINVEFEVFDGLFQGRIGECFNWHFSFKENHHHGPADQWSSLVLAISAIRKHFEQNFGILFDIGFNSITLRFDESEYCNFPSIQIHVHTSVLNRLFAFLSRLGCLDVFMGHLFYWAQQNSLLDGTLFESNFDFGLLIVFYLEQLAYTCDKAPFPTIEKLIQEYSLYTRRSIAGSLDLFEFCNDQTFLAKVDLDYFGGDTRIGNWMIFDFFEFCHNFDFSKYVICPYDGIAREKEAYEQENNCKLNSIICIEGPHPSLKLRTNEKCTEERMQQFKHLIDRMHSILKDCNQPEMFYIEALTNPSYFINSEYSSNESQALHSEAEVSDLTSDDEDDLYDCELSLDSIADLFADSCVIDELPELNEEKNSSTVNDLISTNESGDQENQSNFEPPIEDQTEFKEVDNNEDDKEDKCRLM